MNEGRVKSLGPRRPAARRSSHSTAPAKTNASAVFGCISNPPGTTRLSGSIPIAQPTSTAAPIPAVPKPAADAIQSADDADVVDLCAFIDESRRCRLLVTSLRHPAASRNRDESRVLPCNGPEPGTPRSATRVNKTSRMPRLDFMADFPGRLARPCQLVPAIAGTDDVESRGCSTPSMLLGIQSSPHRRKPPIKQSGR